MNKKIYCMILSVLFVCLMSFMATSFGAAYCEYFEETGKHLFNAKWIQAGAYHYQVCDFCGTKSTMQNHSLSSTSYKVDGDRHARKCSVCGGYWDYAQHDWSNNDGICKACKYQDSSHAVTIPEGHNGIGDHKSVGDLHDWDRNGTHYRKCAVSGCKYKYDFGKCEDFKTQSLESGQTEERHDYTIRCSKCGEVLNHEVANHTWSYTSNKDELTHKCYCSVCGYVRYQYQACDFVKDDNSARAIFGEKGVDLYEHYIDEQCKYCKQKRTTTEEHEWGGQLCVKCGMDTKPGDLPQDLVETGHVGGIPEYHKPDGNWQHVGADDIHYCKCAYVGCPGAFYEKCNMVTDPAYPKYYDADYHISVATCSICGQTNTTKEKHEWSNNLCLKCGYDGLPSELIENGHKDGPRLSHQPDGKWVHVGADDIHYCGCTFKGCEGKFYEKCNMVTDPAYPKYYDAEYHISVATCSVCGQTNTTKERHEWGNNLCIKCGYDSKPEQKGTSGLHEGGNPEDHQPTYKNWEKMEPEDKHGCGCTYPGCTAMFWYDCSYITDTEHKTWYKCTDAGNIHSCVKICSVCGNDRVYAYDNFNDFTYQPRGDYSHIKTCNYCHKSFTEKCNSDYGGGERIKTNDEYTHTWVEVCDYCRGEMPKTRVEDHIYGDYLPDVYFEGQHYRLCRECDYMLVELCSPKDIVGVCLPVDAEFHSTVIFCKDCGREYAESDYILHRMENGTCIDCGYTDISYDVHLMLNDELFEPSGDQMPPVIVNDRTLVPVREVVENVLEAQVDWDDSTKTVTITAGDTVIEIPIGSNEVTVNGETKEIDVPAKIINDKTMMPIRFIAETCGLEVNWDDATKTVSIK